MKCFERVLKKLSINIEEMEIDYDVLFVMMMHQYKGNYRELENILASLVLSAQINHRDIIISLDLVEMKEIFQCSSDPTYIAKCILSLFQHIDNSLMSEEEHGKLDENKKIFRSCPIEIIVSAIGENRNIGIEIPVKKADALKYAIAKLIISLSAELQSMGINHADKNKINHNQNKWSDYKDYLLNDFINKVPLKGIVSEADDMRSMLIERKVIDCLKSGKEIKSILVSEGLPERSYQNYLKKIKNITGKGINEFKQLI